MDEPTTKSVAEYQIAMNVIQGMSVNFVCVCGERNREKRTENRIETIKNKNLVARSYPSYFALGEGFVFSRFDITWMNPPIVRYQIAMSVI